MTITRRTIVTALAAIPAAAAATSADVVPPSPSQPGSSVTDDRLIDQRLEQLPPLERHYATEQFQLALEGQPSVPMGDAEAFWSVHFEQWKAELAPWFKELILGGEIAA